MKLSVLALILLTTIFVDTSNAQFPMGIGGEADDLITGLTSDGSGGYITSGYFFSDAIDLGSGAIDQRGYLDGFVAHYDGGGVLQNAIQIGADSTDLVLAVELEDSNLLVCGEFSNTVDFDNGPGVVERSTTKERAMFVARYTLAGEFVSVATTLDGTDYANDNYWQLFDCTGDGLGNTFVSGSFSGDVNFQTELASDHAFTANGPRDIFLLKLDSSGQVAWVMVISGSQWDIPDPANLVADGNGGVYMTGRIQGANMQLDPLGSGSLWSTGFGQDGFLAQYNSDGEMVEGPSIVGAGDNNWQFFRGLIDNGQGQLLAPARISNADAAFRLHRKSDLSLVDQSARFVRQEPGGGRDGFGGSRLSNGNYIGLVSYTAGGVCPTTCDINSPDFIQAFPSLGSEDVLIANLDSDLNYLSAVNLTSTGFARLTPNVVELGNGDLIVAGWFENTLNILSSNESLIDEQLVSSGGRDAYILKIAAGDLLPVELIEMHALAIDNQSILLTWATQSERQNAGFEVQYTGDGQWLTAGFVEGAGDSDEIRDYQFQITDLSPGRYKTRLKQVDFDGAFTYSSEIEVSLDVESSFSISEVYPNPSEGEARFSIAVAVQQEVSVELFDLNGRLLSTPLRKVLEAGLSERVELNSDGLSVGSYFVRITGERFVTNRKLVLGK